MKQNNSTDKDTLIQKRMNDILEDFSDETKLDSWNFLNLVKDEGSIVAVRYNREKKELLLMLESGTRIFIDNIQDPLDISIT